MIMLQYPEHCYILTVSSGKVRGELFPWGTKKYSGGTIFIIKFGPPGPNLTLRTYGLGGPYIIS